VDHFVNRRPVKSTARFAEKIRPLSIGGPVVRRVSEEDMTMRTRMIATTLVRTLFGLAFFVFGLDGFLHFLPRPTTAPPEGAMAFAIALMNAGYMFPLIKGTELVAGALLLGGRFVPLALVLLAPVLVNIVAFHVFLASEGLEIAVVLLAVEIGLAWAYRAAYRPLLAARVAPPLAG
jgi:uncharacterized membrane protein YphA (DoxX/SURF4 family)